MTYDAWLLELLIAQDLAALLDGERGQRTVALFLRTCVCLPQFAKTGRR